MGIHSFPILDGQPDALTEARRDMWLWAEPIIADLAAELYEEALSDRLASTIMTRRHCRLWRAVIHDQPTALPLLLQELHRTGATFGLDPDALDRINIVVLEELVDVVLCRFRASRTATKTFSLVLMSATSRLGAPQAA